MKALLTDFDVPDAAKEFGRGLRTYFDERP